MGWLTSIFLGIITAGGLKSIGIKLRKFLDNPAPPAGKPASYTYEVG